ncbi:MAG: hypothetical protein AABY84_08560 [Candidatus Firestonebacteria bacterium]|mgnify:CR=1 FL=1
MAMCEKCSASKLKCGCCGKIFCPNCDGQITCPNCGNAGVREE